tara:strand:+ start:1289 stop:1921 length:633 start_codon:yes stop_codon:yes gene_type:complete
MKDIKLHKRLLELLYSHKEEHVGSCFTCIDIIDDIFKNKAKDDIFILSNGHAAYALYCVLEKYNPHVDADDLAKRHGGHPNIEEENGIYCSTGSLGSGIIIAVGRALANPNRTVHVTLSDGECAEGCVWEALRFIEDYGLKNIKVHVNCNGWACYDIIDVNKLELRLKSFLPNIHIHRTNFNMLSFLKGLDSHYMILNNEQYEQGLKELS